MRDETGQTGKVSNKEVLDCNVGDTGSDCHVSPVRSLPCSCEDSVPCLI